MGPEYMILSGCMLAITLAELFTLQRNNLHFISLSKTDYHKQTGESLCFDNNIKAPRECTCENCTRSQGLRWSHNNELHCEFGRYEVNVFTLKAQQWSDPSFSSSVILKENKKTKSFQLSRYWLIGVWQTFRLLCQTQDRLPAKIVSNLLFVKA